MNARLDPLADCWLIVGFDGGYGDHRPLQKLYNQYTLYSIDGFFGIKLESDRN